MNVAPIKSDLSEIGEDLICQEPVSQLKTQNLRTNLSV